MYLESRAPGRICLFGEHQDYMSLSVITAAIDLRIIVSGFSQEGSLIEVSMSDTGENLSFEYDNIIYSNEKDYIKSVVKVLKERGKFKAMCINAELVGNIPMRSGVSSSSALSVAWSGFLMGTQFDPAEIEGMKKEIAEFAYIAEVEEFGESGGRMDQYASAFGGINYFTFYDDIVTEHLDTCLSGFVLGDSGQPKDTQKTLRRIRGGQEAGLLELYTHYKYKSNAEIDFDRASSYFNRISADVRPYLEAVLTNHKITEEAKLELVNLSPDNMRISSLMNQHHSVLRDKLNLSTKKIEKMISGSLGAGALSAKINGSGEGGCMFAYCPGKEKEVAEVILSAGGTPHIINISEGIKVKTSEKRPENNENKKIKAG